MRTALRTQKYVSLIAVAAIGLLLTSRQALAQLGNRYFYGAMVTEDPDPGNGVSLALDGTAPTVSTPFRSIFQSKSRSRRQPAFKSTTRGTLKAAPTPPSVSPSHSIAIIIRSIA